MKIHEEFLRFLVNNLLISAPCLFESLGFSGHSDSNFAAFDCQYSLRMFNCATGVAREIENNIITLYIVKLSCIPEFWDDVHFFPFALKFKCPLDAGFWSFYCLALLCISFSKRLLDAGFWTFCRLVFRSSIALFIAFVERRLL